MMKYYTQSNKLDSRSVSNDASGSMSASGSRRFKGAVSDAKKSNEISLNDGQSTALSGGSTAVSSKNRLFDEKFKFVKDSAKPDPSLNYLKRTLKLLASVFLVIFIAGILIVNLFPTPKPYYEFLDQLAQLNVKTNELIFSARYLLLQQHPEENYGPCSFDYNNRSACPFIKMGKKYENETNPRKTLPKLKDLIHQVDEDMIKEFNAFQAMYLKIRIPGDELDKKILGNFDISMFVNGSTNTKTDFQVRTLWNAYSLFIEAGEIVAAEFNVEKAQREWNFIVANRYTLNNFNIALVDVIPGISSSLLANLALAHLILLIICIAVAVVF